MENTIKIIKKCQHPNCQNTYTYSTNSTTKALIHLLLKHKPKGWTKHNNTILCTHCTEQYNKTYTQMWNQYLQTTPVNLNTKRGNKVAAH